MKVSEIIDKIPFDNLIGKKFDNKDNGILTKFQGEEVECVGIAIATKGKGCQQIAWVKSKNFIDEDDVKDECPECGEELRDDFCESCGV